MAIGFEFVELFTVIHFHCDSEHPPFVRKFEVAFSGRKRSQTQKKGRLY